MKRKTNGIFIKRVVDDRDNGIYVETDILQKTITIGRGIKRKRLTQWEAARLSFLLKRQLDRLQGNYPKETARDEDEFLICPHCGITEKSTANFCGNCGCELNGGKKEETEEKKFERLWNNYLKSHKRVLFITGGEGGGVKMHIEDDLKHFGIEKDELESVKLFRCENSDFFREKLGINFAIGECERLNGKAPRKARIILDYDADFPNIVTRVISR